jgi:tRNA(adenine34) deaminase
MSIEPLYTHEYFMKEALKEAQKAFDADEIPVGAVIVADNRIIARAHNLTERLNDVTAHAEMQAITAAANAIGGKYLIDCTMYLTLEPCVMCAGAIAWSQLSRLVFGAHDPKKGFTLLGKNVLHPKTEVITGIFAQESEKLLKDFFINKRK